MAYPAQPNEQITDSVTQSNVKVIGEAPAMAMGTVYESMAHSCGILFQNAVSAQQQSALQQSALQQTAQHGVMQIYSVDTGGDAAKATERIAQAGAPDNLSSLLTVLNAFKQTP
ncbi:R body protein RebB-like protein [Xanthomonas sp. Kuri4-1]